MRKIIFLMALCIAVITSLWFLTDYKKNESAAFKYAKEYVIDQYNEDENLTNGGIRYDVGRGNYSVIVQNDKNNKYYLEVKLSDDLTLVSIEDDTSNIEAPAEK